MSSYRLKPEAFNELKRSLLIKTVPISILVCGPGIYLFMNNLNNGFDLDSLLIAIPLLILFSSFVIYRSMNTQKKAWKSYKLTIDENTISKEQKNLPTINIRKTDLKEIIEYSKGHIKLTSDKWTKQIVIPQGIEDRDELMAELAQIGLPITNKK